MQLVSSGLRGSGDSAVMRTLTYNHRGLGLIHRVGLLPPQKSTFQITIRPGNSGQEEPHECAMLNYHSQFPVLRLPGNLLVSGRCARTIYHDTTSSQYDFEYD